VVAAVAFGLLLLALGRGEQAAEFFAGYVTEYSLSVDNLFVFVLILARFAVPEVAREKVLLVGIVLSLVLRAAFILAGTALISAVSWTFCLFGLLLLVTAVRLVSGDDPAEGELGEYRSIRLLRRRLPLHDAYVGSRLRVTIDGRRLWTR
jgi:tellurite resistance protein TerC